MNRNVLPILCLALLGSLTAVPAADAPPTNNAQSSGRAGKVQTPPPTHPPLQAAENALADRHR